MSESSKEKRLEKLKQLEALNNELKELEIEEAPTIEPEVKEESEDEIIQKETAKQKKERTERQKEQFKKALEAKRKKDAERKQIRQIEEEELKKEMEKKIIEKAIKLKKKQIKKIKAIEELSDDDEIVIQKVKKVGKPEVITSPPIQQPIPQRLVSHPPPIKTFRFV
jgi:hypothetical protein